MNNQTEKLKRNKKPLVDELKRAGAEIKGKSIKCPFHDDTHPSGGIYQNGSGFWKYKCHGCGFGGDVFDVRAKIKNCPVGDVLKETGGNGTKRKIIATYDYRDETGELLYQVVRYDPKNFRYRRPEGNGGWVWNLNGTTRILYRLPELIKAEREGWAFLLEGEKDVDRLSSLQLTATTAPMGAGKWRKDYNEFFRNRHVVILPDNDKQGRDHAHKVAQDLVDIAEEVKIIKLPGLPEKGDVSDWLDSGGTRAELLSLVEQTPSFQAAPKPDSPPTDLDDNIPYLATRFGLFWMKPTKEGPVAVPLTNFTAHILSDVVHDDGVEQQHNFEIEAILKDKRKQFVVSASRFSGMAWVVENLGARAIIYPGFAIKDHCRAAIQMLSKDISTRVLFTHTGWRKVDDDWVFLHGDGAIGPNGPVECIETKLYDSLKNYRIPSPPSGAQLHEAIRASLNILDLAPDSISIPLYCLVWRSMLGPCTFSAHLSGPTGAGKTEIAALIQQHFGSAMHAKNLPGSWSSTGNALEGLAFLAKDVVCTVDDFAPQGSPYDVQRYHREADRILRAQGNRSCRQRMRSDATLRPAKPPRGLILSTGEDIPKGQSLRARTFILEMAPGDMDWKKLTVCQRFASQGIFAEAMAGFIHWLAPQYEKVCEERQKLFPDFREMATQSQQHRRTPEIIADLALGMHYFLCYAQETGAITFDENREFWGRCWSALGQAARAQDSHMTACEPVQRFLELISAAIDSGQAHVAGSDGCAPSQPGAWGWRERQVRTNTGYDTEWESKGDRIGWVDGDNVYLIPDASFRVAERMVGNSGEGISVQPRTLHKRMDEKGLLLSKEKERLQVKVTLEGKRRRVLHIHIDTLLSQKPGPSGPTGPGTPNNTPNEDPVPIPCPDLSLIDEQKGAESGTAKPDPIAKNSNSAPNVPVVPVNKTDDNPDIVVTSPDDLPSDWQEEYQERLSIIQGEEDMLPEQAAGKALAEIICRIKKQEHDFKEHQLRTDNLMV